MIRGSVLCAVLVLLSSCEEVQEPLPCCWQKVALGGSVACGLRTSGEIACWGAEWPPYLTQDWGTDRTTQNWQDDGTFIQLGSLDAPSGRFVDLDVGEDSCAITAEGELRCWGQPFYFTLLPPNWQTEGWGGPDPSPEVPWTRVDVDGSGGCVLNAQGEVDCFWGWESVPSNDEPNPCNAGDAFLRLEPPGPFVQLRQLIGTACGQRDDRTWTCWGRPFAGAIGAWAIPTADCPLTPGLSFTEHLRQRGITLWVEGTAARDLELYRAVNGPHYMCYLDESGAPHCPHGPGPITGDDLVPQTPTVTAHKDGYIDVALGADHACFLHESGAVDCIGDNSHGQRNAPDRSFASIWAGDDVTCGITANGGLSCWGDGRHGQLRVPGGL